MLGMFVFLLLGNFSRLCYCILTSREMLLEIYNIVELHTHRRLKNIHTLALLAFFSLFEYILIIN